MKDARLFLIYWLFASVVLYFAPFVFAGMIVTGNARLTPFLAGLMSGFLLASFQATTTPIVTALKLKLKEEWQWTLAFLLTTTLGLWLIARYADLTGVGINNVQAVVFLGVLITIGHWVLDTYFLPEKKSTRR